VGVSRSGPRSPDSAPATARSSFDPGTGLRLLMAVVGLAVLVLYATAAFVVYRGLLDLWARRPAPATTVLVVLGLALTFGYVSYRGGVAALRRELDTTELPRARAPDLYRRVEALAAEMDIDPPPLAVGRMGMPNALALGGPRDGLIVMDPSLLRLLSQPELDAILAHELAHLETRDALVKTLGSSVVRTVTGLAVVALLPLVILAVGVARALAYLRGGSPREITTATRRAYTVATAGVVVLLFVFTLALRAYSRRREFAADDRAVEVTGQPVALGRALLGIDRAAQPADGLLSDLAIHGDEKGTLTRLLATHPPMERRVERLADRSGREVTVSGQARARGGRGVRIEVR
jgi:heat shock protein HtpX